jgi:hypothetical protein
MNKKMPRRDFTVQSALAVLGGVAITITGCSDSDSPTSPAPTPPAPPPATRGDVSGVVSENHGHVAVVTEAQLTASNTLVLDITGTANHPHHRVELSASELSGISSGQRVSKPSTTDFAHNHTVTFN